MATLRITEGNAIAYASSRGGEDIAQVMCLPPLANQTVTFTTSTQSAVLNGRTRLVRLRADADCYIAVGSNPTATSADTFLPANETETFGVDGSLKIAVVAA